MSETQSSGRDLTSGSLARNLAAMAGPMLVGYLALISVNVVDTFFIGQLGEQQLAAMGFSFPIIILATCFASGIAAGVQSVVSRAMGNKDVRRARRATSHGIALAVIGTGVLVCVGLAFLDEMLELLGAAGETLVYARAYMRIWFLALWFYVTPLIAGAALMAAGDAIRPMAFLIAGAILNGIFDPLLIFGLGPFPQWGMEGAAIASAIARGCVTIGTLAVVLRHPVLAPKLREIFVGFGESSREILRVGIPSTLNSLVFPISLAVVTWALAGLGDAVVAAYAAGARIDSLSTLVFTSVGFGLAPIVGQNWGAGLRQRVIDACKLSMKVCVVWGLAAWAVLATTAGYVATAFVDGADAADVLWLYLVIAPASYAPIGVAVVCQQVLTAIGRSGQSAVIAALSSAGLAAVAVIGATSGPSTVFVGMAAVELSVAVGAGFFVLSRLRTAPMHGSVATHRPA